jgi:hypothetical protein
MFLGGWMDVWMGGSKSGFKDCLQQSKIERLCIVLGDVCMQLCGMINLVSWTNFVYKTSQGKEKFFSNSK